MSSAAGGSTSTLAQGPPSLRQGATRAEHAARCLALARKANKFVVKPLLVIASLTISFIYFNGLLTRATNVYELPFKNGQSFCVVGNGPGVLQGEKYGKFINSHDVVVRFNTVVTQPSEFTGNRTDMHVIVAGSPKQHIPGTFSITVYSSWIHDTLAEWAHPYTFPLHAWGAKFKEETGTVGPSSGLLMTKFLSEVFPASRVSTIGMGEFTSHDMSMEHLHYFSPENGTVLDRINWSIEGKFALHHNNESGMFARLRASHKNLKTVQQQVAAGAERAPRYADRLTPGLKANASRHGDANSSLRRALRQDGFQLVSGVFTRDDAQQMREEMLLRRRQIEFHPLKRFFHRIVNPTGLETVDFMHRNRAWYAATSWLSFTPMALENKLKPYLAEHFGDDAEVDWFFHNDIGINHLSRWHKDRLNNNLLGRYRDNFEQLDPWEEGPYDIYKCLIYLQDHGGPNGIGPALDVIPGSHRAPPGATGGEGGTWNDLAPQNESDIHPVAPTMGDVIIFDQRITHRGHSNMSEVQKLLRSLGPSAEDGSDARILVTVGFGLRRSKHLAGFKKGTLARQGAVFFVTERLFVALEAGLVVAGVLFLYWLSTRKWSVICSRRTFKYLCGSHFSRVPPNEVFKPLVPTSPAGKGAATELVIDSAKPTRLSFSDRISERLHW